MDGLLAAWTLAIISGGLWVGFCLAFATDYARDAFYAAWVNLAVVLIPVVPAGAAPWVLALASLMLAGAPFIISADIKRKRRNMGER